jgi:hypothetical protein
MLIYPKSLLQLWSDYHSTVSDIQALVTAHIKGNPSVAPAWAELRRAMDREVENEWTQQHVDAATAKLSDWCVGNERYFCNVKVEQHLDHEDKPFARWPAISAPTRWQQFWSVPKARVKPAFKIKPFASGRLRDFDLVLIDAPICMDLDAPEREAYMCDAPSFARRADDARLPLILSDPVRKRLTAYASGGADWLPFCRTLGVVRRQAREQAIQVLQVSVRTPRFPNLGWSTGLISEAREMKRWRAYSSDSDFHFLGWVEAYRAFVADPHKFPLGSNAPAFATPAEPDFAWVMLRVGGGDALKHENNPYRNAEGFWTALASVLPAWRNYFPLTAPQVDALLREFDATYDTEWRGSMKDLALSGLLRFTPEVMDTIRKRIAGLI